MTIQWTIHPITDDPNLPPMYAVLPDDDTNGLLIGEEAEVRDLAFILNRFLDDGLDDGEISRLHPRLGFAWLTVNQARGKYQVPGSSITWACRRGLIRDARKVGKLWEFPELAFRNWLHNRRSER